MRTLTLLLMLAVPLTLPAQGTGALAKMDKLASQALHVKPVLPQKVPARTPVLPPITTQHWAHLEHVVHRHIQPTANVRVANYAKRHEARAQYAEVMSEFLKFKKEADIFLYYRAQQVQNAPLAGEETRQWLERIYEVEHQLNTLRGVIRAEDIALKRAYTYLNDVIVEITPNLKPFKVPQIHFKRTDRIYKQREFFLHEPILPKRLVKNLKTLWSANYTRPENLQIAIFNDCPFFIDDFLQWYKQGTLFGQDQVVFFTSAQDLLTRIAQGHIQPDVIITDILSDDGMGGIFLAQELRNQQYNGVILALSAYEEKEISGPLFMAYGFDGMISNPKNDTTPELRRRMNQALNTYFYYRNNHGWER